MFLSTLYPRKKVGQNDLFGKIKVGKTKVSNKIGQNASLGKMKVGKIVDWAKMLHWAKMKLGKKMSNMLHWAKRKWVKLSIR